MEKKSGFKRGWDAGRDVETITPLGTIDTVIKSKPEEDHLKPGEKLSTPAQRIIADLRQQLEEAKARIAELEGEQ